VRSVLLAAGLLVALAVGGGLATGGRVHRTGRRFRGVVRWKVRLVQDTPLVYGSLHGARHRVPVLGDGYSH